MGKGDKKTKRGKIIMGSYGNKRPRKTSEPAYVAPVKTAAPKEEIEETKEVKKAPAKKAATKKTSTKKVAEKKAPVKKAAEKKAPAKKAAEKKAPAKKVAEKKAPAKKVEKKEEK